MTAWKIHKTVTGKTASLRQRHIISTLLAVRGLTRPKAISDFLSPPSPLGLTPQAVGISPHPAVKRVRQAITTHEPIVVYGDYDADGICSTAILWETLFKLGAQVTPFIPDRVAHGYGLSIKGIQDLQPKPSLIITVDNGIVAHPAVEFANRQGIDVIITDHHVPAKTLPQATAIFHTTQLAGSGVSWLLSKLLASNNYDLRSTLELAAIGSIADMVPLLGPNRSIVSAGLSTLRHTHRLGLTEIFKDTNLQTKDLTTYDVNYIIAPRLNAQGRLGHALDSLRLLCTTSPDRAKDLAAQLGLTNQDRQQLTEDQLLHAKTQIGAEPQDKLIVVSHHQYHQGIIGLIAGKLVEHYYRPAVVLSVGKTTAKGSARSIAGVNIIDTLRQLSNLLIDVGGHPMAAGFTIATANIDIFQSRLKQLAQDQITDQHLIKTLAIDCRIDLADITWDLHRELVKFEPFGIANPRPVFASLAQIASATTVGADRQHLKLSLASGRKFVSAIGFRFGHLLPNLNTGTTVDIAYTIDANVWNGRRDLQLTLKDLHVQ